VPRKAAVGVGKDRAGGCMRMRAHHVAADNADKVLWAPSARGHLLARSRAPPRPLVVTGRAPSPVSCDQQRSARQMLRRHESELGGAASDTVRDQTDTDAD
jgi:hypothetical protein